MFCSLCPKKAVMPALSSPEVARKAKSLIGTRNRILADVWNRSNLTNFEGQMWMKDFGGRDVIFRHD
jgi:hypothetical protein